MSWKGQDVVPPAQGLEGNGTRERSNWIHPPDATRFEGVKTDGREGRPDETTGDPVDGAGSCWALHGRPDVRRGSHLPSIRRSGVWNPAVRVRPDRPVRPELLGATDRRAPNLDSAATATTPPTIGCGRRVSTVDVGTEIEHRRPRRRRRLVRSPRARSQSLLQAVESAKIRVVTIFSPVQPLLERHSTVVDSTGVVSAVVVG